MEDDLKVTRVTAEVPTHTSPEHPHDPPARNEWGVVRRLALKQLDRLMSLEPKVLRGDHSGAIHDIRVASRRLQASLDLLYPKPRPREIRSLRRKLRRTRRSLSNVRNCDVLVTRVEKILARKRLARRGAWLAVRRFLRDRRTSGFEKAVRKLGKTNLAVFYVSLKRHLTPEENTDTILRHGRHASEHEPAGTGEFLERVALDLQRLWQGFESQLATSQSEPSAANVHSARIATKRLRYLVEIISEFSVSGSTMEATWLRRLQTHLGEWHDLEVLEQMMIAMVARPEFLRDQLDLALEIQKLIVKNRAAKKVFEREFFRMTLDSPEVQRLKAWVDYLLSSPSAAFANA